MVEKNKNFGPGKVASVEAKYNKFMAENRDLNIIERKVTVTRKHYHTVTRGFRDEHFTTLFTISIFYASDS